ncbi:MAG: thioredoxin domain-containing protein [Candidatus Omnitrophica bacterium]|nr:thioredoxin domain-containing protein [Candidatus Omnitrophota bacterium]
MHEKSPYLLQHAHNPVDWYPWGEEAFQKAKKEGKPIFLSVGYSTCHWCHVMEEESFSNPEIAKMMNKNFVSIKVDREERPDVDNIYMQVVMAMTGAGGWPMTVILTPDLKPFFGGTYFPPEDRWGSPGLKTILNAIARKWKTERKQILESSESITQAIRREARGKRATSRALDKETLEKAYQQFESQFDSRFGGFGRAPKFPRSHTLSFLLRYWKRTGEPKALEMVEKTLQQMARGGMYDHIGSGFHRYSTDGEWRVPHFEKMLYDQAILSKSYLEAYQATGKEEYASIAREIFEYVLRDMTPPPVFDPKDQSAIGRYTGGGVTGSHGAFYSAEDADSAPDPSKPEEKSEGAFYLWSQDEVGKALGKEKADIFNFYFGVEPDGNAPQDPHGEFEGRNILYVAHSLDETASKFGKSQEDIQAILRESKKILFDIRSKRFRPHLDDKVLTDWNGLMISSLAFGSRVLNEPRYAKAAKRAADFLLEKMKREDGRLMHRYRDEEVAITGFIEDYAFFTHGLFDLYEATFDPRYLAEAKFFVEEMRRLFLDETGGGFFLTAKDAEKLIARSKELYDGALPSGNSVAALSLLRVGRLTVNRQLEDWSRSTLNAFSTEIDQFPSAYPQMLIALDFAIGPSSEIVIAGGAAENGVQEMIRVVYSRFLPNKVVAFHPKEESVAQKIEKLSPFISDQIALGGQPTVYVCENYICALPTTDIVKLNALLAEQGRT